MSILKRVKDASVEDIKEQNEDAYTSIFEEGKKSVEVTDNSVEISTMKEEIATLKAENDAFKQEKIEAEALRVAEEKKAESEEKILTFAASFDLQAEAQTLIKDGKSNEEVYEFLAENIDSKKAELADAFEGTAASFAGGSTGDSEDSESVKTYAEARDYIQKRDECSKSEAAKKARLEFPSIVRKEFTNESE